MTSARLEVPEDREHASVVFFGSPEVELGEDASDVLLDRCGCRKCHPIARRSVCLCRGSWDDPPPCAYDCSTCSSHAFSPGFGWPSEMSRANQRDPTPAPPTGGP